MKTHKSIHLFFIALEVSVMKSVFVQHWKWRQAKKSSEVRFVSWWLRVLRRSIKSKHPGMLPDGIILLYDNARPHTANLVRDKLSTIWLGNTSTSSVQHRSFPLWLPEESHSGTSVSFGRGSARVGEVVYPCVTYLFLQNWS